MEISIACYITDRKSFCAETEKLFNTMKAFSKNRSPHSKSQLKMHHLGARITTPRPVFTFLFRSR